MYCSIHRSKQQVFMGNKRFSNQVDLTLNFNDQSVTFYVKKFAHPYFAGSRVKLTEDNMFATTQYTAATGQDVIISLRKTKLNENSELCSGGKSLLVQDLGIYKTINESIIKV